MDKSKDRQAGERMIIKTLVNLKCAGRCGKAFYTFSMKERGRIFDELIKRGYIDEHLNVLPASQEIVTANLDLSDF